MTKSTEKKRKKREEQSKTVGLTEIRTRDLPICSRPPCHLATNPVECQKGDMMKI